MSVTSTKVNQCCETTPVWIFIYSDGRIRSICDEDYNSPDYRIRLKTIINIKTKQEVAI